MHALPFSPRKFSGLSERDSALRFRNRFPRSICMPLSLDRRGSPEIWFESDFVGNVVQHAGGETVVAPVTPQRGLRAGGIAEDITEINLHDRAGCRLPTERVERNRRHGFETGRRLGVREFHFLDALDGIELLLAGRRS